MIDALRESPVPVEAAIGSETPAIARPRYLLFGALVLGFVIEALLHGQPLGTGYTVAALVAIGGSLYLGRGLAVRPSRPALALLALLAFVSLMVAVRASPAMQAVNVLADLSLILLIAGLYIPGGLAMLSLADYAVTLLYSSFAAIAMPFLHLLIDLPKAKPEPGDKRLTPIVYGLLLAIPLLFLFGALFAAADAVFAAYLRELIDIDLEDLIVRVFFSLMLAWPALGLLRHAFTPRQSASGLGAITSPAMLRVGGGEAITVLALLNVLFISFVVVQAVYLFGGADTLARGGLTHSEYARRGFFELVAVAALVLSLILLLDWLARPGARNTLRIVNLLHGSLVVLTLVILVSALQRMYLYQQEYGLTELRFYPTAFMIWLAVVLVWLVATMLVRVDPEGADPRRRRFAFGALVAGLAVLAAVNLVNPDAFIARVNMARATRGIGKPLDTAYLTNTLSADAVPVLLSGIERLPDRCKQAELAKGLLAESTRLDDKAKKLNWRGTVWGNVQAQRALAAAKPSLARYQEACPSQ
ncbi:MAG: DUF4173 domain-containing protein [Anaerolineae bacterium]|nr:DUF4173 domain-containing protein [Anaerolineae bacterium]